jgi:hypothetical protein
MRRGGQKGRENDVDDEKRTGKGKKEKDKERSTGMRGEGRR